MSTTAAALIAAASVRLRAAGVDDPAGDARRLMAFAIGCEAAALSARLRDPVDAQAAKRFEATITARMGRQPVSQITGVRAFWGRMFRITPDVLDPRPETETLIEAALAEPFQRILDLGTGSGAILLTLLAECPAARGLGTDASPAALAVARANADALGLGARAAFQGADWWQGLAGQFDLIVSNPPYVAAADIAALSPEVRDWEPHEALTPGITGLEAYRAILAGLDAHLAPDGRAFLEIGFDQGESVRALAVAAGFDNPVVLADLGGCDRVVALRKRHPVTAN